MRVLIKYVSLGIVLFIFLSILGILPDSSQQIVDTLFIRPLEAALSLKKV